MRHIYLGKGTKKSGTHKVEMRCTEIFNAFLMRTANLYTSQKSYPNLPCSQRLKNY